MNRLILLLVSIFLITIAGCGVSELPSGRSPSGESPSGELPSGELPSGELPSGKSLAWNVPTLNVDGSPLTDLAGYKILWGPSSGNYTGGSIDIGLTLSFDTQALPAGYYCFVVVAYDTSGNESPYSGELCENLT